MFSVWFTNNVYDKDNFLTVTTQTLQSEEVRSAVAANVVERFSDNYPILGQVAGPTLNKIFLGILDSSLFDRIYTRVAESTYTQLTTNESTAVVINVKDATDFLMPLLQAKDPEIAARVENLPSEIVIIPDGQLPNISAAAGIIMNFGRALGLVGLGLVAYWIWREERGRAKLINNLSLTISLLSAFVFLSVSSLRDFVVSQTTSSSGQILAGELYDRFTVDLSNISILLFFAGLITVAGMAFQSRTKTAKR